MTTNYTTAVSAVIRLECVAMSFPTFANPLPDQLVFEFMWKFSAFECAIKRLGCYKPKGNDGPAEPNWDDYANRLNEQGVKTATTFLAAAHALVELAPKQQIVKDGKLGWSDVVRGDGETYARFVLRLVCTVRNNLFHGGKYEDGPVHEVARNKTLLEAALALLTECYEFDQELQYWIYDVANAA